MPHIDLNCDLGESFGAYTIGMDEKVIPFITSANVACGFHAGDPLVMQRTVALCKQSGVAVGAHPGFPDLQGFGRRQMKLTPAEAILAATLNAAHAIGMADRVGSLEAGKQADLVVMDAPSLEYLPYHFAMNHVNRVYKRGLPVV